ncbi:Protein of unknown function (DUF1526) [Sanguibacter keddieii DSM 10542]|uniref:Abi-like protein n=1 Tax=Sanguibacter keddieii (strain ATCC 51767 / DSM 10542 / NCFB 3025 / ST-74) TaxID=446469 RepID=D1BBW5_SANKS|nr:hypothetical protein [Sanguibacter keddieii]ACZ20745.1 Protein of unknown function (DUF1526) [Sanguibacter keddieii DSM 10542]
MLTEEQGSFRTQPLDFRFPERSMTSPEHGAWVTAPRFQKYVTAAGGDPGRALALYDWNAQLAAAWLRDVGHLEVGLRNAYDRALLSHPALGGADWLHASQHGVLFPPRLDLRGVDANAGMRGKIRGAHRTWRHQAALPPRGKVLAEMPFSFWTSLTAQEHEATIWTPVLHRALHAGTDRTKVHPRLAEIRELRNRAAHMESIFTRAGAVYPQLIGVTRRLDRTLASFISQTSQVPDLLAAKP